MLELVAFDTADKGVVVIEPWSHRQVIVEEGKIYQGLSEEPVSAGHPLVYDVTIVW